MKTIQITLFALGLLFLSSAPMSATERWLDGYEKVLVIGAHPDDPETMCGGTMIKLREMGVDRKSVV